MNNYDYYLVRDGDRFFLVPFLLGGLGGAAVVGLSRPRPVYVNTQTLPPRPPYYGGYGANYNYYY